MLLGFANEPLSERTTPAEFGKGPTPGSPAGLDDHLKVPIVQQLGAGIRCVPRSVGPTNLLWHLVPLAAGLAPATEQPCGWSTWPYMRVSLSRLTRHVPARRAGRISTSFALARLLHSLRLDLHRAVRVSEDVKAQSIPLGFLGCRHPDSPTTAKAAQLPDDRRRSSSVKIVFLDSPLRLRLTLAESDPIAARDPKADLS